MAAKRTPAWLGDENAALALDALLDRGPLTRNGIAAATTVSKQTAAQIVARLEEQGLILQEGEIAANRGPAAAVYGARDDVVYGVAVDIDQQGVAASIVDVFGRAREVARESAESFGHDRSATKDITYAVLRACSTAGVDFSRVGHVCVGVPMSIDPRSDELSTVDGLPGWSRGRIRQQLEEALGCRVELDNDVNLAAIVERKSGEYAPSSINALIWMGRGTGLALDIGGRIMHGASGGAGEVGHLPVSRTLVPGVAEDLNVEDILGADAIDRLARDLGYAEVTFASLLRGEPIPAQIIERLAPSLAQAVIPVLGVIDPDHVVLGGPVGRAGGEALAAETQRVIRANTRWDPPITLSRVAADPVLRGAQETLRWVLREDLFTRARTSAADEHAASDRARARR